MFTVDMYLLCTVDTFLTVDGKLFLQYLKKLKIQSKNLNHTINATFIFKFYRKNIPKGIICGVMIVTVVYVLVNLSIIFILNLEEIKTSDLIFETLTNKVAGTNLYTQNIQFSSTSAGPYLSSVISLAIALSLLGTIMSTGLTVSRWIFSAAREGHLPRY